jgi:CheY-like chemotaxis protein
MDHQPFPHCSKGIRMSEFFSRRPNLYLAWSSAYPRCEAAAAACRSDLLSNGGAAVAEIPEQSRIGVNKNQPPSPEFLKTILLVSNDRTLRSMLRSYLGSMGYLVFGCADAPHAAQVFHNGSVIDLLLLDLHLLGASALELAAEVTAESSDLPVVFITGPGTDQTVLSAIKRRGWSFLCKPVLLAHLFALIQQALGRQEASRRKPSKTPPARVVSFPLSGGPAAQFTPAADRGMGDSARARRAAGDE